MNLQFLKGALIVLLISASTFAKAEVITLDPADTSVNGGSINYTLDVTDISAYTDAIFSLNIAGDFDNNDSSESVDISIDGFSLGTVFDNNVDNDLFNFSGDDYIGDHNNMITMTSFATINQADWANMISDGSIDITFNLSSGVNCCTNPHAFTSGTITYNTQQVPEPSSLAILALGIMGLTSRKFKKQ